VLGITASPQEYDDYVELLIKNPRLGHTYKAYFGDIYQLDGRLLPEFDYVSLFHVGEFRTPDNDAYGALTDLEMTLVLADKPIGEWNTFHIVMVGDEVTVKRLKRRPRAVLRSCFFLLFEPAKRLVHQPFHSRSRGSGFSIRSIPVTFRRISFALCASRAHLTWML
jgi:hypothetical protein